MANKREKERREKINAAAMYKKNVNKILPFYIVSAVICVITLLFYFLNWTYIYNYGIAQKVEVGASGFSFSIAAVTGKYSSTDKVYGNLAVPFYYYAKSYCEKIGVFTILSLVFIIASAGVSFAVFFTKKQWLALISIGLCVAGAAMLFVSFGIALSMKNSRILPVYCGGNPKCSIRSLTIIPALIALCGAAVEIYAMIRYVALKKEYEAK